MNIAPFPLEWYSQTLVFVNGDNSQVGAKFFVNGDLPGWEQCWMVIIRVETMVMSSEWDSLKGSDIPSRKKNFG